MKKQTNKRLKVAASLFVILLLLLVFSNNVSAPNYLHKITGRKSVPEVKTPTFNKNKYSLTNPNSIWVVANKLNPLNPSSYVPSDLVSVGGGQYMRASAASALTAMLNDARSNGLNISPLSGYRSYQTQVAVYAREVKTYGQTVADTQSARPGYSEHQTGLAVDVGGGGCAIADCFSNTKHGQWVANNGHKYGFIIRYPSGKSQITGYRYEPWHIRYVGVELATEMHNQKIKTLEEFFGLKAAPSYQ